MAEVRATTGRCNVTHLRIVCDGEAVKRQTKLVFTVTLRAIYVIKDVVISQTIPDASPKDDVSTKSINVAAIAYSLDCKVPTKVPI